MKDNYPARVDLSCSLCAPRSDAKSERGIRHAEHDHSLVFRSILRYPTEVRFEDMVPIQERHLPIRLDPHLQSAAQASDQVRILLSPTSSFAVSFCILQPATRNPPCTLRTWQAGPDWICAAGTCGRSSRTCQGMCRARRGLAARPMSRGASSPRKRSRPGRGAGGRRTAPGRRRPRREVFLTEVVGELCQEGFGFFIRGGRIVLGRVGW